MINRIITIIFLIMSISGFLIIKKQLFAPLAPASTPSLMISENQQKVIGDTHYLFDVGDNGPDQIKNLLERAELLSKKVRYNNENSRIAMIIHGPDINIFDQKNYNQNKDIVDLAARLDAFDVIDFKVCETSARSEGIRESSFPAFMEVVPFAPAEIKRLKNEGYIEF